MQTAARRALGSASVVSLSGGIDAPAVAAFAAPVHLQSTGRPLSALSSVYPDLPAVDESRYIELVSERLGLELHTFVPSAGPLENIKDLTEVAEAPVPTVSLAESAEYYALARELGFHTILTGEMAEFVMAMGIHTLPHLLWRRRFPSAWRYLQTEKKRGVPLKRMLRSTVSSAVPETWRRRRLARLGHLSEQKVAWMSRNKGGGKSPKARFGRDVDTWESQQLSAFAGPGLSVEADEALQAAHGVRVRRPWLDIDLWEFFISLPAEVKYPSGQYKALVRRWLRGIVPDEILDRRDRTFFDDSFFARLDLVGMRELISSNGYEMPGVDYSVLKQRLEDGGLSLIEAMWAKDLAVIHAFMEGGN
jgi:asparagine synthase (glutamine-hydrolysing)